MKSICLSLGRGALLAVLVLPLGCAMAPKAEAPPPSSERMAPAPAEAAPTSALAKDDQEPATLADAEALLEKARADLDRLALNEPGAARSQAAGAAAPAPAAAPSRAAPARDEETRADKPAAAEKKAADAPETNGCETACKAFSSLTRASDAVCRLDTEGGKRCERARQIREDASRRVASCGCLK